jgi:hypothetical protein
VPDRTKTPATRVINLTHNLLHFHHLLSPGAHSKLNCHASLPFISNTNSNNNSINSSIHAYREDGSFIFVVYIVNSLIFVIVVVYFIVSKHS